MHVFISYAHKDGVILERLLTHLKPLMRGNAEVDIWSDRRLNVSQRWKEEIESEISRADVAILIISANFYESDFITNDELRPLLDRERSGECKIFCLLAGPSPFTADEELSRFHAMPDPSRTLSECPRAKRDRILQNFCSEVRNTLRVQISGARSSPAPPSKASQPQISRMYSVGNYEPQPNDFDLVTFCRNNCVDDEDWWGIIKGHTFKDVRLVGPIILCITDNCKFIGCTFDIVDDNPRTGLMEKIENGQYAGVSPIKDCRFENCTFFDVGFTGDSSVLEELESAMRKSLK